MGGDRINRGLDPTVRQQLLLGNTEQAPFYDYMCEKEQQTSSNITRCTIYPYVSSAAARKFAERAYDSYVGNHSKLEFSHIETVETRPSTGTPVKTSVFFDWEGPVQIQGVWKWVHVRDYNIDGKLAYSTPDGQDQDMIAISELVGTEVHRAGTYYRTDGVWFMRYSREGIVHAELTAADIAAIVKPVEAAYQSTLRYHGLLSK